MIRVDWMYNWWRIDMLRILVVVMRVFMMRVFTGIDIWLDITRIVLCSWNAVSSPRMIKDLVEVIFWYAQVVIITNLMEWVLDWI